MRKKLIVIHTDSDFWITLDDIRLYQREEKVFILVDKEQDFINLIFAGRLRSNEEDLLKELFSGGHGEYGNYSYYVEDYVPFIHELS